MGFVAFRAFPDLWSLLPVMLGGGQDATLARAPGKRLLSSRARTGEVTTPQPVEIQETGCVGERKRARLGLLCGWLRKRKRWEKERRRESGSACMWVFDGGWARVAVPGGQAVGEGKGYGLTLVYRKLSLCDNTDVCLHDLKRDESHTNKPETLVHMHRVI